LQILIIFPSFNMGYRPSRDSKIDPKGTHDLVEGFTLKWEESRDGESGNKWPAAVPGLRRAAIDY
jgi:hypothetical protein